MDQTAGLENSGPHCKLQSQLFSSCIFSVILQSCIFSRPQDYTFLIILLNLSIIT